MNKAIILLSGGLDSVVSLAIIRKYCDEIMALTFNYGQKSFEAERKATDNIIKYYNIHQKIIHLDWLADISDSALNTESPIPDFTESDLDNKEYVLDASKALWVPNRNGLFVNIAACYADAYNYDLIVIGTNKEEAESFKDNSITFINSVNSSFANSTEYNVKLIAPLAYKTKQEIVADAINLNVPFHFIHSCYISEDKHCGKCESCLRLKRALEQNKRQDLIDDIFKQG